MKIAMMIHPQTPCRLPAAMHAELKLSKVSHPLIPDRLEKTLPTELHPSIHPFRPTNQSINQAENYTSLSTGCLFVFFFFVLHTLFESPSSRLVRFLSSSMSLPCLFPCPAVLCVALANRHHITYHLQPSPHHPLRHAVPPMDLLKAQVM